MENKEKVLETHRENARRNRMGRSSFWKYSTVILVVLLVFSLYSGNLPSFGSSTSESGEVVEKAVAFINDEMLAGFATAELVSVEEGDDYYRLDLAVEATTGEAQEFTSYVSKDGELLFPTAVDLTEFVYEVAEEVEETEEESTGDVDYSNDPTISRNKGTLNVESVPAVELQPAEQNVPKVNTTPVNETGE